MSKSVSYLFLRNGDLRIIFFLKIHMERLIVLKASQRTSNHGIDISGNSSVPWEGGGTDRPGRHLFELKKGRYLGPGGRFLGHF